MNLGQLRARIRIFIKEPAEGFWIDDNLDLMINDASFEATKDICYPYKWQSETSAYEVASALTGTLTFTNASTAVTGSSTAFTDEISALDWIYLDGDVTWVQVQSITDDTNLTLTSAYSDTGGSGASSLGRAQRDYSVNSTDGSVYVKLFPALNGYFNNREIEKVSTGRLIQVNPSWKGASSATPEYYYKDQIDKVSLYPSPATAGLTFTYPYVYKEAEMDDDSDESLVAEHYSPLIINRVVAWCRVKEEDDEEEIIKWMGWYQQEMYRARSEVFKELTGSGETTKLD